MCLAEFRAIYVDLDHSLSFLLLMNLFCIVYDDVITITALLHVCETPHYFGAN